MEAGTHEQLIALGPAGRYAGMWAERLKKLSESGEAGGEREGEEEAERGYDGEEVFEEEEGGRKGERRGI